MKACWVWRAQLTRISLPIKVVLRVAVALEILPILVSCGAVGERDVVVGDVIEKVDFLLLQH